MVNSVDPDETPYDAAFHPGLRCLLIAISVRNILNIEINILDIPLAEGENPLGINGLMYKLQYHSIIPAKCMN